MQNALISDFHEVMVAVLPLMLIFLFINQKKWLPFFICLIVLLGFKESFAGLGVVLGIYIYLKGRNSLKIAVATVLISLAWGILTIFYLIPYLSDGTYFYSPSNLPISIGEFISRFVYPDNHWKTILYSFLTFGFLPIINISIFPAIFENFFERYVLSSRGQDLAMHYNALLSPLMFMGA